METLKLDNMDKNKIDKNNKKYTPSQERTVILGDRNKFITISAVTNPERMSFLGTSFAFMEKALLSIMSAEEFPVRLEKCKHLEGIRWALAASGEAFEPWKQLYESLDKYGTIEVEIAD